jgi:hypothetical protein
VEVGDERDFRYGVNWRPAAVPDFSDKRQSSPSSGTYTVSSALDHFLTRLAINQRHATLRCNGRYVLDRVAAQ